MNQHMDPLDALKVELASVSLSPEFAQHVRARIATDQQDHLELLGRELSSVGVSPEFAVRVRQQIESSPARPRWFAISDWRWAVPLAAAAGLVAFVLTRTGAPGTRIDNPSVAQVNTAQTPIQRSPQAGEPAIPSAIQQTSRSAAAPVRITARTRTLPAASGQQADDKLEVITYQPAVYRQLWAAAAAAQVVQVAELPREVRDIAVAPLEVGPVVVQWLVEPPKTAGGSVPEIRRISADAERSDK